MNVLSFTGGLGRDCETRFTAKGDAVTSFSVALSSGYGDSKLTTWMNCTIFGKRGESLAPYLLKGAQVAISGEFAARPYTNKAGEEKLSLDVRVNDVTLMGGKQSNQSAPATNTPPAEFDDSETIPF
jgi:single-strand DNA-binding protein